MDAIKLIREGDWVSGTTAEDEKFIGFVESLDESGVLKVWVTQCDRESTIGTSIETRLVKARKLPASVQPNRGQLRDLIELALVTRDRAWFDELADRMASAPDGAERPENRSGGVSRVSRLGNSIDI